MEHTALRPSDPNDYNVRFSLFVTRLLGGS